MAKTSTPLKVYLDTSVFLAWLKDENRPSNEMDGVHECFEKILNGEIQAIVSSLIRSETDMEQFAPQKQAEFWRLISTRNPLEVGAELRVFDLAGELRWFFLRQHHANGTSKLSVPDAIHLATAIQNEVHSFYAFDKKVERKFIDVLNLTRERNGHSLVICKPPVTRPRLPERTKNAQKGT